MAEDAKEPTLLAACDKGHRGQPGHPISTKRARVYRMPSGKFKLRVEEQYGSNQGYEQWHDEDERNYRHADLDQLLAIALAEEEDKELRAAIRDAIGEAEELIDAEKASG